MLLRSHFPLWSYQKHTPNLHVLMHQKAHPMFSSKAIHTAYIHSIYPLLTHRWLSCSHRNSCSPLSSMSQQKRLPCLELSERTRAKNESEKERVSKRGGKASTTELLQSYWLIYNCCLWCHHYKLGGVDGGGAMSGEKKGEERWQTGARGVGEMGSWEL